jgi:hypothetical protein
VSTSVYSNNQDRLTYIKLTGSEIINGSSIYGNQPYIISASTIARISTDGSSGLASVLTSQDEIVVVRKFTPSEISDGTVLPILATEYWEAWTLPNTASSGSSMYSMSNYIITFSQTASDYVWTRSGTAIQLPSISANDTVYIINKTKNIGAIARFQTGARITSKSVNAASDQPLFIGQELLGMMFNFPLFNPCYGAAEGVATLDSSGYLKLTEFNTLATYFDAGSGLAWTTTTAGDTTKDTLALNVADAPSIHSPLKIASNALDLQAITSWASSSFGDSVGGLRAVSADLLKTLYDQVQTHDAGIHFKGLLDIDDILDGTTTEPVSPGSGDTYDIIETVGTDGVNLNDISGQDDWECGDEDVNLASGDQIRWDGAKWFETVQRPFIRLDGASTLTGHMDMAGDTYVMKFTTQSAAHSGTEVATTAFVQQEIIGTNLSQLNDVDTDTDDTAGNMIYWDGDSWADVALNDVTTPGIKILSTGDGIEDLADVASMTPSLGNVLEWNGVKWTNGVIADADSQIYRSVTGATADGDTNDRTPLVNAIAGTGLGSSDTSSSTTNGILDLQNRAYGVKFKLTDDVFALDRSEFCLQNGTINFRHPFKSYSSCFNYTSVGSAGARMNFNTVGEGHTVSEATQVENMGRGYDTCTLAPTDDVKAGDICLIQPETFNSSDEDDHKMVLHSPYFRDEQDQIVKSEMNIVEHVEYAPSGNVNWKTIKFRYPFKHEYTNIGDYELITFRRTTSGTALKNLSFKNLTIKDRAHRFINGHTIWEKNGTFDPGMPVSNPNGYRWMDLGTAIRIGDGVNSIDMNTLDIGESMSEDESKFSDPTTSNHTVCAVHGLNLYGYYTQGIYGPGIVGNAKNVWGDVNNRDHFISKIDENNNIAMQTTSLEGLFTGSSQEMYYTSTSDFTIVENAEDNATYPQLSFHCNTGIRLEEAYDIVFEDCVFEHCGYRGVHLEMCMNVTFRNCTFKGGRWANLSDVSKGCGIFLEGCQNVLIEGCSFEGCNTGIAFGAVDKGANYRKVGASSDIKINNCTFNGISRGISMRNTEALVLGCTVTNCTFNLRPGNENFNPIDSTGFVDQNPCRNIAARGIYIIGTDIRICNNVIGGVKHEAVPGAPHYTADGSIEIDGGNPQTYSNTAGSGGGTALHGGLFYMAGGLNANVAGAYNPDPEDVGAEAGRGNLKYKNYPVCDIGIFVVIAGQNMHWVQNDNPGATGAMEMEQYDEDLWHVPLHGTVGSQGQHNKWGYGRKYPQTRGCLIDGNTVEAWGTGIYVIPYNKQGTTRWYAVCRGISINNNDVKALLNGILVWHGDFDTNSTEDVDIKDNTVLFGGFPGWWDARNYYGPIPVWRQVAEGHVNRRFGCYLGNDLIYDGDGNGNHTTVSWQRQREAIDITQHCDVDKNEIYRPAWEMWALNPAACSGIITHNGRSPVIQTNNVDPHSYLTGGNGNNFHYGASNHESYSLRYLEISGNNVKANYTGHDLHYTTYGRMSNLHGAIQVGTAKQSQIDNQMSARNTKLFKIADNTLTIFVKDYILNGADNMAGIYIGVGHDSNFATAKTGLISGNIFMGANPHTDNDGATIPKLQVLPITNGDNDIRFDIWDIKFWNNYMTEPISLDELNAGVDGE